MGNDEDGARVQLQAVVQLLALVQWLEANSSAGSAFSKTQSKMSSRPHAPDRCQDSLQQLV